MTSQITNPRNVAHSALISLEIAEYALMPNPACHSRLWVALRAVESSISFLSFPTATGRTRLRLRLDDLFLVQSNGIDMGNLPPDSLIDRGLSLAIFITQTALAGIAFDPEYALREAREIEALAGRPA